MAIVGPELRCERVDNLSCVFNSKRIKKLFNEQVRITEDSRGPEKKESLSQPPGG